MFRYMHVLEKIVFIYVKWTENQLESLLNFTLSLF